MLVVEFCFQTEDKNLDRTRKLISVDIKSVQSSGIGINASYMFLCLSQFTLPSYVLLEANLCDLCQMAPLFSTSFRFCQCETLAD